METRGGDGRKKRMRRQWDERAGEQQVSSFVTMFLQSTESKHTRFRRGRRGPSWRKTKGGGGNKEAKPQTRSRDVFNEDITRERPKGQSFSRVAHLDMALRAIESAAILLLAITTRSSYCPLQRVAAAPPPMLFISSGIDFLGPKTKRRESEGSGTASI